MQPLISIITPNYNCGRFIAQTIESVLAQTYRHWEMLIVDDCSTDNSYQIALEYSQKDTRIKVFQNEKNSGAAVSRNKAIELSQGEYLAFLDSDDLWLPEKLERQLQFMQENDCDFSYCRYSLIDENNVPLGKVVRIPRTLSYVKYLHHCFTGCLTVMYRKDFCQEVRSFDVKNNNDFSLFLQVVKKARRAMGYNEVTGYYRIRSNSISRKKTDKVLPYFQLMHDNLNYPYLLVCWFLFCNVLIGKVWKYKKDPTQFLTVTKSEYGRIE